MLSPLSGGQEFSAESTSADGESSQGSSIADGTPAFEEASENESTAIGESCPGVPSQAPAAFELDSDRRQALVEELREARLRACALRTGKDCHDQSLTNNGLTQSDSQCTTENLIAEVRDLRMKAAIRRTSLDARSEDMFTVSVCSMSGRCHNIDKLHANTQVLELCEIVASRFAIPTFAVRLIFGDEVLHMSQPGVTLGACGVSDGSELMLAINWGWAKPDLQTLVQLEKQWQGRSSVTAS
jgi:hypothetical protein